MWHSLPEGEWLRLKVLHVPKKLLRETGDDQRAWLQHQEAMQCALTRANREAPHELKLQLQEDDKWYQAVYETAALRVSTLLTDPEHYMNGHVEPVAEPFKVKQERPRGRLDVLRRLSQHEPTRHRPEQTSMATERPWTELPTMRPAHQELLHGLLPGAAPRAPPKRPRFAQERRIISSRL